MSDKPLNLHQRISAIRAEVLTVAKNANVDNKYEGVTHDDVTEMVRPLMVKHGVTSSIEVTESEMIDTGVNWGKRKLFQYRGKFACELVNEDDPNDRMSRCIEAHADDNGDKAPGKALSYAMKSFYLKVFAIKTGEDDEQRVDGDKVTERVEALTEPQLVELHAKAEELFGDDAQAVLSNMAEKVFRVDGYQNIQSKHFDVAMNKLRAKAEKGS